MALWERQKGTMRLVAVDARAGASGLMAGQNLSDARALVPDLDAREIDHAYVSHVFADFADWHSNASPIVAVHDAVLPYGDLVLDIAGVAHLFGGEAKMLHTLVDRLRQLGFTVSGGIADTVGAAWAMARFAPGSIIAPGDNLAALDPMPVMALRLADSQLAGLNQMGLKRVGQLYDRDRHALQARFGASLILRLDQALGEIEERVIPRLPIAEHHAERRFAEPIGYIDDVMMTARDLAIQLAYRLEAEGQGAQSFHLMLYRVDHKVMTLSVNAGRATRDPAHIARLFVHRSERLEGEYDAGFGIDMIRLAASSVTRLDSTQVGVFDTDDGAADLSRLYDRMTSRLGPLAIVRSKFVDTHIPERAVQLEPVIARTPDDPAARPDPPPLRPLRLLPQPEPIEVIAEVPDGPPMRMMWRRVSYRIARASGPERIEAEWWRSGRNLNAILPPRRREENADPHEGERKSRRPAANQAPHVSSLDSFDPMAVARDYYVAEDESGRRFWLFRLGLYGTTTLPRWYLHGFFS